MSLLRRKSAEPDRDAPSTVVEEVTPVVGKGRPTPKRRDAERRRGPVAPPPKTQREAVRRSKTTGRKLSKDERRALSTERRERMMRGEDAYLLPRDRGEIRAFARDVVDARRNLAGLLLPIALLSFLVLVAPFPLIQAYAPLVLMVAIVAAVIDSVLFGRRLSRQVASKFPKGDKSGQSAKGGALGFYAFNRACLIRKWRVPRPRVERGALVD